jgi:hypothetical protein
LPCRSDLYRVALAGAPGVGRGRGMEVCASTDAEIAACFAVMQVLRPDLQEAGFAARVRSLALTGYGLAYGLEGERVAVVAGFRLGDSLARGPFFTSMISSRHPSCARAAMGRPCWRGCASLPGTGAAPGCTWIPACSAPTPTVSMSARACASRPSTSSRPAPADGQA